LISGIFTCEGHLNEGIQVYFENEAIPRQISAKIKTGLVSKYCLPTE
jgi:hypothetical protein